MTRVPTNIQILRMEFDVQTDKLPVNVCQTALYIYRFPVLFTSYAENVVVLKIHAFALAAT